jgi:hypothetical protein
MDYQLLKLTIGVVVTLGLYSILYRETRLYRFFEHLFLGLSVGWAIVAFWTEVLKEVWWDKMFGVAGTAGSPGIPGVWPYAFILPLGCMAYFVFSQKHNWISRIPIGIMLGFGAGQQIMTWWTAYGPQIKDSMRVIVPTYFTSFTAPQGAHPNALYPSQAINNILFVVTLIFVLSYFLFSVNPESRYMRTSTVWGRWLMMVGFGAIFGSTVMARLALVIDRMHFVWVEWFIQRVLSL